MKKCIVPKQAKSIKKIKSPSKNKKIGRPNKNSGYAEEQPSSVKKK
ncbi:MAG: hypothetical protein JO131_00545 [Gammaproteobacteria bacterium]|nr:hypothetical protein [Gammaproteobacteria bacterium]